MSNNVYISQYQSALSTQDKTYVDPIAQSFTIDTPGGAFLTSLNLYFQHKDSTVPVSINLREMEDGSPSGVIIPFSQVTVAAADVNVSDTGAVATKFTFPSPVFLLDNTAYCFVINANSDNYRIWTARTGAADVSRYPYSIIKQPFAGSVFRSQNAGVWAADTTKDIKFDINRAEFASSGTAVFNEATLPTVQLGDSPFETTVTTLAVNSFATPNPSVASNTIIATLSSGSNTDNLTVNVSRITISGAGTVGQQQLKLNGSWIVTAKNSNTFTFTTTNQALAGGSYSANIGTTVLGSPTVRVWQPNHGFTYANTSEVTISGVASGTFNGIPYSALVGTHTITSIEQDSYTFDITTLISSGSAVYASTAAGRTGGTGWRATTNRVFDVLFPNVQNIVFQNTTTNWSIKANSAKSLAGSETPYELDDAYLPVSMQRNNKMPHPRVIRSDNGATKSFILKGDIATSNRALSPVIDLNRSSLITVNNRIDNPSSSVQSGYNQVHNFIAETASVGSSTLSKYITKKIDLNTPASALRSYIFVNRPAGSSIAVYYKVLPKGSDKNFDLDIGWTAVSPVVDVPVSDDPDYFFEAEYDINESNLSNVEFTSFAFKVVFTSTNSSAVSVLKNFRAIAVT